MCFLSESRGRRAAFETEIRRKRVWRPSRGVESRRLRTSSEDKPSFFVDEEVGSRARLWTVICGLFDFYFYMASRITVFLNQKRCFRGC